MVAGLTSEQKPLLIVDAGNLPKTATDLRDMFATAGKYYDRGMPTYVVRAEGGNALSAMPLTNHIVAMEAHRLCQPVKVGPNGELIPVTLPNRVAAMYLGMIGRWMLPALAGISSAPLLSNDGSIRSTEGYDHLTKLLCEGIPELDVAVRPSYADAMKSLMLLRTTFRTFPFSDAERCRDASLDVEVTDISKPIGHDESAFLVALMTAVCRPSLSLAPALLVTAPAVSGAGSGKGLLVRAICCIAFGIRPSAFTTGGDRQELDKRLAADLIEAQPVLFLDNANGIALRSDLLASVLTERPVRVRLLGKTRMVPLNSTAFVAVTGNALTVTEDLARRFILCELDARCENPESRPFASGFLDQIESRRGELLAAILVIWRWGRQNAADLKPGMPLGSFENWAQWCRDPLLAVGCHDPAERIDILKAKDPHRQQVGNLFRVWHELHGTFPVRVDELAISVKDIADPQRRGRQYLATFLASLEGTRAAGFVLTRQGPAGKWGAATYALEKRLPAEGLTHRTHRTHRALRLGL